ncbi:radical SAM protein [Desulfovibrio subterraneus]|uniref:radical SAM protein n=1 Tax=Desulfovibrio subterraneus TaxID=2718620 RepID=UPI0022B8DBDF|nr:radical SAM protein [Desulfovibrio subterraneus]WBF66709.1 radical SAM protein [Desulfovibrio subterraneus]
MTFTYIFGPVTSSRLGRSLGLDLLGRRVCSMDCLYCEVGRTDELTMRRAPYVPAEVILAELEQWRAENEILPDHVTLGGAGEPCLNSEMGAIIDGCRRILPEVPVAVLTNTTLLSDTSVCAELAGADIVLPSLDSLVEEEFIKLNRPCGGLSASDIAESLLQFRAMFKGRIFLEILLAQGINDSEENLALLKDYVKRLSPDRVDVTTLSRPGAYPVAKAVPPDVRVRWCSELSAACAVTPETPGTVFLRTGQRADLVERDQKAVTEIIVRSLQRRPQTPDQLALALSLSLEKVESALAVLVHQGVIHAVDADAAGLPGANGPFYSCR